MTPRIVRADTNGVATARLPDIQAGTLTIYQLYDIGDEINLDLAQICLAKPTAHRHTPVRVRQSESIQIAQPPLRVELGAVAFALGGISLTGTLRTSIYDLGAVALAMELSLPQPTSWATVTDLLGAAQELPEAVHNHFLATLEELERVLQPALTRPQRASIVEDYSILVVERMSGDVSVAALAEHPVVWAALLGEQRPLSPSAAGLITSMSYYPDDLALLTWNGALLLEPEPLAAATAADLIEFANVELLLMRSYDADLDAELPRMYRQLPRVRSRFALPLVGRYSRLLHDVQRLIAELTEVTERVDNALKVTDDVYWNRLYSSMLNVLRVNVWRGGVEHKLALLRETYSMLHEEADAERGTALEWTIILLIVFEIVMALVRY
jgi:hypothetical protein